MSGTVARTLPEALQTLVQRAARLLVSGFDALLPAECLGCGHTHLPHEAQHPLCPTCASRLRPPPWPRCPRCHAPRGTDAGDLPCLDCAEWPDILTRARSAVVHDGPAPRLVAALKYQGWRSAAEPMAHRMVALLGDAPPGPLVPVPTTARRRRRRGYNQAEVLARALAARGSRTVRNVLERRALSTSQIALQRWQRVRNVHGTFHVPPRERTRARDLHHVILLDDVLTTGSTASAAALALGDAGVRSVTLITFARALPFERRGPHH